jgi:hypothetical protein
MIFLIDSTEPFLPSTHVSSRAPIWWSSASSLQSSSTPVKNSHLKVPTDKELTRHDCDCFAQSIGTQWYDRVFDFAGQFGASYGFLRAK